jgi:hypothetical protein
VAQILRPTAKARDRWKFFFAQIMFSLSAYEIWKVLVSLAKKYIFIANFHILGHFLPKNKLRAKTNFPFVTRRFRSCRPGVGRNLCRRYLSRLKGYRFEISATLRQLGWIFEISRANSGVKKKSVLKFL